MPVTSINKAPTDKLLIEMSQNHYDSLLKRAKEVSPLYFRLKNSIKTETGVILIPCDATDAKMLLGVAKHFCPDAVAKIEFVISSHNNPEKAKQAPEGDENIATSMKQLDRSDRFVKALSTIAKAKNLLIKGLWR